MCLWSTCGDWLSDWLIAWLIDWLSNSSKIQYYSLLGQEADWSAEHKQWCCDNENKFCDDGDKEAVLRVLESLDGNYLC